MVPAIYLFDRFDGPLGILPAVASLTHTEELGGEDTIEFDCAAAPEKGSRLLWRDPEDGAWREHVVVRTDEPLAGSARVYAESSISELLGDFIEEERLSAKTAAEALAAVLAHTRWTAGDVGVGDARRGCLLYHVNALAALRRVEEVWDGEIECSIAVEDGRVAGRTVSLPARRGGWRGARLTRGKGLIACTRTVLEDEVFTALYGFGRGLPVLDESGEHTGGYTRRLTFGAVNNGVNWVGSDEARLAWGRPDGSGGRAHRFGCVVFAECEDASELKALTEAELARVSRPRVAYEAEAARVCGCGFVGLGDDVAVCDDARVPPWRFTARCVRRIRELGAGGIVRRLALGAVERTSWSVSADVAARVATVEETAAAAGEAAAAAAGAVSSLEDLSEMEF